VINVAVIGTGYIGPVHVEALRRLRGVSVKGVADVNRDLARQTADRYNLDEVYDDWTQIVEDPQIDVVHVCSPNKLHYLMNKAAVEHGKHVLSEKPLAMALGEAEELTALAEERGVVTGVDFCYRYYPVVREMALRVRRGDAGTVRLAMGSWLQDWLASPADWSWRLERTESGDSNTAADLGSHWFDLVQFTTGLRVTEVMADFATVIPRRQKPARQVLAFEQVRDVPVEEVQVELEDYAAILFRFSNGAPGSFTTCQAAIGRRSDTEFQIYGSKCSLAWNHRHPSELWIGWRDRPNETLIESPVLQQPASAAYTSLPSGHPMGYHDAVLNLFKDFYGAVMSDDKREAPQRELPRPTFRTGWEEMRILRAVVDSNAARAWVKVD
jgi:predicted dehydrogenase